MSNVCAPTVGTPEVEWTQSSVELGPPGPVGTLSTPPGDSEPSAIDGLSVGRDFPSDTNIGVTILVTVKG